MSAIIFDLDGTLVDSAPDIHLSVNKMLKIHEHDEIDLDIIRSFIGNGIPKLIERVIKQAQMEFSKELHEKLIYEFTKIYSLNSINKTKLYKNVRTSLDRLKKQGYLLGICTNKAHAISQQILYGLHIDNYFASVIGGDSLKVNKPNPAMLFASMRELGSKNIIFVGDSEVDAATAINAKVPFVLYTKGYLKIPVSEVEHVAKFDDYLDLDKKLSTIKELL